jgi:L-ascorbate metabolism protein UlaG (beta-lactamase superfamily)
MWITIIVLVVLVIATSCFVTQPKFGKTPRGDRKERVIHSPNYRDGEFKNRSHTPQMTSDKGYFSILVDFAFKKKERLRPKNDIPSIKTDLLSLDSAENVIVWFGHSSYFIQVDGKRILVDPVFSKAASPVSFYNKSFKGTNVYKPEDIPDIDYLIISHDHWDHLDYPTVKAMRPRVKKVIFGLGVGQHFERWKFSKGSMIEMDWDEQDNLGDGFEIYCLPARHFSGRFLNFNQSLWTSFLLKTPNFKIYIGGDSGYDTHYTEIGERFNGVDLAILEDGQYDKDWKYIHMMPEEVIQATKDLKAKSMFPVHNSKLALGNHPWDEPLKRVSELHEKETFHLITPIIGEKVMIGDTTRIFDRWWENIE